MPLEEDATPAGPTSTWMRYVLSHVVRGAYMHRLEHYLAVHQKPQPEEPEFKRRVTLPIHEAYVHVKYDAEQSSSMFKVLKDRR